MDHMIEELAAIVATIGVLWTIAKDIKKGLPPRREKRRQRAKPSQSQEMEATGKETDREDPHSESESQQ